VSGDAAARGYDVAIVAMCCRFPGAPDLAAFWRNLRGGVESVSRFSDDELRAAGVGEQELASRRYVRAQGVLDGIELFDAPFFGASPREAETMDPQHRIFLECAWEALETAGYDGERGAGPIGVFASVGLNSYLLNNLLTRPDLLRSLGGFRTGIGNDKDYVATRVSYKLDLTGPSLTVQTACSSSLVAVHLACQSLLNLECDMALAGGVAISVPQRVGYWYEEGGIGSPDGRCRAFDADARGTVFGNGAGVVVLKRLDDALAAGDQLLAVIRGSAINNDGGAKVGYTAPSVRGQSKVVTEALAVAGVGADTISYVEAHGTGTAMGDPIELAALCQAFAAATSRKGFCAVGSVKTNVGHLAEAAGVAGLIKAVLALAHEELPPSLHFTRPNPEIDFAATPFFVQDRLAPWPRRGAPRRAGVSSFGIGGTNVHLVLEEAPPAPAAAPSRRWQLLVLSARTDGALAAAADRLAAHLEHHPELPLADVAHTLRVGRRPFERRLAVLAGGREEAIAALAQRDPRRVTSGAAPAGGGARPVAFLFPGQGAQHPGMGAELYAAEEVFRREVDRCAELLAGRLGLDLCTVLCGPAAHAGGGGTAASADLDQTWLAQPALFVLEYALARLWMAWGVQPEALAGHSVGEWVAACLAEVVAPADALALVAERGRLLQSLPPGGMLALRCSAAEAAALCAATGAGAELALAASNGPRATTVAGPLPAVAALAAQAAAARVACRRLPVSHAFHSAMVEPVVADFARRVAQVRLAPPRIPFLSNVTGTWVTAEQATDPGYWASHLRATVRFGDGLAELLRQEDRLLLEVGPGRSLCALARQQQPAAPVRAVASLAGGAAAGTGTGEGGEGQELAAFLHAAGFLWAHGASVGWEGIAAGERRRRVPLPTYSFERRRHWVEPGGGGGGAVAAGGEAAAVAPAGGDTVAMVDAAALPAVAAVAAVVAVAAAGTEGAAGGEAATDAGAWEDDVEARIAAIWRDLLGVPVVRAEDDFFQLGGDSLLGTQLISRLGEIYPVELPLRRLFEEPTLGRLAAVVREQLLAALAAMSEEEAAGHLS
jgi:phthiocerol/phenolphthiocerol synthesis type-I polyketide synthase E